MGRAWKTRGMAKTLPSRAPYYGPFMPIYHDTGCWWGGDYGPNPVPPEFTPGPYPGPKLTPGDQPVPQVTPQDQPPVPAVPQDQPVPGPSIAPGPAGSAQPNPDTRFVRIVNPHNDFWQLRDVDSEGYPWKQPAVHVSNYPTPGTFFDSGNPNGAFVLVDFKDLVRACLASALYMAGGDVQHATSLGSTGKRLRREMADAIQTGEFNDSMYGTSDVTKVGHESYVGPHGRGINLEWVHADNLERMHRGEPALRTTTVEGDRISTHQAARARPLIWLPALDLNPLHDSYPTVQVSQWEDGVSTAEPPLAVRQLGYDLSGVELPGGPGHLRRAEQFRAQSHLTSRQVWGP